MYNSPRAEYVWQCHHGIMKMQAVSPLTYSNLCHRTQRQRGGIAQTARITKPKYGRTVAPPAWSVAVSGGGEMQQSEANILSFEGGPGLLCVPSNLQM